MKADFATQKIFFFTGLAFCLSPWSSSTWALALGVALALIAGNPFITETKKHTSQLLSLAVMGLGAGMNLNVVARVGLHGALYTVIGIFCTMALGLWLGKFLKVENTSSRLISIGTAICGGSAIAALAPVIRAKSHEVSVSLGTVFVLNAVALMIFPPIGHALQLSQNQFGLWSALAIHDTSSVVGATIQYGAQALEVGTTVKLARALWIIPIVFAFSLLNHDQNDETPSASKTKKPWFILGFLLFAALGSFFPEPTALGQGLKMISLLAKKLMVVTLFLIGSNLSWHTLKAVGLKPLAQGLLLWVTVATASLYAIASGLIQ